MKGNVVRRSIVAVEHIIADNFETRVLADSGNYEGESDLIDTVTELDEFYDTASLILTAHGWKVAKLYALKPTDGTGDLAFTRTGASVRKSETTINAIVENEPRINFDEHGNVTIVHEPSRINVALQSQTFDNASWTKTNVTIDDEATTDPIGGSTADKLLETTANSTHVVSQLITKAASAITYTRSIFVKAEEREWVRVYCDDGGSTNNCFAYFNISDGYLGSVTQTGTFVFIRALIEDYGSGWFRCIITFTTNSTTSLRCFTYMATADGTVSYQGVLNSGVYLWGEQVEAGSYRTSYIATTSGSVTRNADLITTKTGISALIGQTQGVFYWEAQTWPDSTTKAIAIGDGTLNNRIVLQFSSGNILNVTIITGGVSQASVSTTIAFYPGTFYKFACVYIANSIKLFINGYLVSEDTAASIPACSQFIMGIGAGTLPFYGRIKTIMTLPAVITDAEAKELTSYTNPDVDEIRYYNVLNTLDTAGQYYFGQGLIQKPSDGNVVIQLFHDGASHLWAAGKKSACRKSLDRGRTWATQVDIYSDATYSVQGGGYGYDSNGRIHGWLDVHDSLTVGSVHKLIYVYSDDDGATWTITDRSDLIPSDGNSTLRSHGKMVQCGDYLLSTFFTIFEEADFSESSRYVLRKHISSGDWEAILVGENPDDNLISEGALEYLGNGYVVHVCRDEVTKDWNQDISDDYGATWTDQGAMLIGITSGTAGPAILSSFTMEGVQVVAAYTGDRGTIVSPVSRLRAVYAKASDIIASGASGWNQDTVTQLAPVSQNARIIQGYGDVLHSYDNFNAIASLPIENDPFDTSDNSFITFDIQSSQYKKVKHLLGL